MSWTTEIAKKSLRIEELQKQGQTAEAEALIQAAEREKVANILEQKKLDKATALPAVFQKTDEVSSERRELFLHADVHTNQALILTIAQREQKVRAEVEQIRIAFPEDHALGIVMIARLMLNQYRMITTRAGLFFYEDGIYLRDAEVLVAAKIQKYELGKFITQHIVAEVIGHLKRHTFVQRDELLVPKDKICVANGVVDLRTGTLLPHTPDLFFLNKLPCTFTERAECPAFKKFLGEVLDPEDVPVVQEMFGYCLISMHHIHKAFMLTGGGANGKSTLLACLKRLLGSENVASVSLQALEIHRFMPAQIYGKLANIYPDLPPTALAGTGVFKCLTGEDQITVERKNGQPFEFVNTAKLIFSANQIPATKDDSDAYHRRWEIIEMRKQFLQNPDTNLLSTITSAEELSGILAWALTGLKKLLEQQRFSRNYTVDEVRRKYSRMSNPIRAFLEDCTEYRDSDAYIDTEAFFAHYTGYCRSNKLPYRPDKNVFMREVKAELPPSAFEGRKVVDGRRIRVLFGIVIAVSSIFGHFSLTSQDGRDGKDKHYLDSSSLTGIGRETACPSRPPRPKFVQNPQNLENLFTQTYETLHIDGKVDIQKASDFLKTFDIPDPAKTIQDWLDRQLCIESPAGWLRKLT